MNDRSIFVNDSNIHIIPCDIDQFYYLYYLELNRNFIKNLPRELFSNTIIEKIWLDCNEIHTLPIEIENLINLVYFSINFNPIKDFQREMFNPLTLTKIKCNSLNSVIVT